MKRPFKLLLFLTMVLLLLAPAVSCTSADTASLVESLLKNTEGGQLTFVTSEGETVTVTITKTGQSTDAVSANKTPAKTVKPVVTDKPVTSAVKPSSGPKLEDYLPELYWELPAGKTSVARYRYHDHVAERFSHAFAKTLGKWCGANKLPLTGHMMSEDPLSKQSMHVGDAMRSLQYFQIPGIDGHAELGLHSL